MGIVQPWHLFLTSYGVRAEWLFNIVGGCVGGGVTNVDYSFSYLSLENLLA